MTNISIINSPSDLDKEELFPVSISSSIKVWSSLDSDTEKEDNIDTDDADSIHSDMLVSLISLVCNHCRFFLPYDVTS